MRQFLLLRIGQRNKPNKSQQNLVSNQPDHLVEHYISPQVDDDSFVVVDKVYDELKHTNYPSGLYWGFFDGRAPVIRGEKERYRETEYVLCDRYIPYALGGGYVLSANIVGFLADNAAVLRPYRAEDASVGTWLAPLKIHR